MSMMRISHHRFDRVILQRLACALALSALAACASRMTGAPVVSANPEIVTTQQAASLGPPPPGYYRVQPGDTLYRIAFDNGQNYHDIASWNNLADPNQITVGQLLRVAPPGTTPNAATPLVSTAPVIGAPTQSAPLSPSPQMPGGNPAPAAAGVTPYTPTPPPAVGAVPPQPAGNGSISLAWPARGPILQGFDDTRNKGIDIGGNAGDPVLAAAGGRVVYAGNGLRGYGNLVIIKHDSTFLTAYAHNRTLLVKEGDAVTTGQKIAEMGNSDSDRVVLHFELRKQGKPVDPTRYLPPR